MNALAALLARSPGEAVVLPLGRVQRVSLVGYHVGADVVDVEKGED